MGVGAVGAHLRNQPRTSDVAGGRESAPPVGILVGAHGHAHLLLLIVISIMLTYRGGVRS